MGKLLVLILLVVVGAWLVRRAIRRMNAPHGGSSQASAVREELVRCAHCGLLLPRSEARPSAGEIYCCEEHARLGPTRRPGGR
jgi:uncharacterized protein